MACRGCANLQCNCFTTDSDTVDTIGNGSQYAPFTFRPNYIPTPRPFGHLWGLQDQSLDGAPYSLFEPTTPDIDQGGNMRTGNGISLTARADGLYLIGFQVPFQTVATDGLVDNFSLRKNSTTLVTTTTYSHATTTPGGNLVFASSVTLLDLNTGDTVDLFIERVVGAGTVTVDFISSSGTGVSPHLWGIWMGGPI